MQLAAEAVLLLPPSPRHACCVLCQARALNKQMPKAAAAVMLPSLGCEQYLHALEAANFDPFLPSLQPPPREGSPLMHVMRVKYHLWARTF